MKKRGDVNEFETYLPIDVDLEKFQLEEGTNKVLVKAYKEDVKKTVGGIITEGIESHNFAENTERRGLVVKTVNTIQPGQNGIETMMHDCDVEIIEGDEVYFNYVDNINSFIYRYKGEIYKLIPYSAIILAVRGDKTIMCNGYVLLEDLPQEEKIGNIYIPKTVKESEGIVKAAGSIKRKYFQVVMYPDIERYLEFNPDQNIYAYGDSYVLINHPNKTDYGTRNLKPGDHVLIGDSRLKFPLETFAYAKYDNRKIYYVCPRHCLLAVLN